MSISYFNINSEDDFKIGYDAGLRQLSSSENNKQIKENEPILLVNKQTKKVFGVAKANGPPVRVSLIDNRHVYRDERFNTYEIPLKSMFIFPRHLDYSDVQSYIGIDKDIRSSLTHYQHLSKGGIRKFKIYSSVVSDETKGVIMTRLLNWVGTYLP
jgi:hypothetical protein